MPSRRRRRVIGPANAAAGRDAVGRAACAADSRGLRAISNGRREAPSLQTLARHVGLSQYHFHRLFRRSPAWTPKGYADAQRSQRLRTGLTQQETVTDAIFDAGYGANGASTGKPTPRWA
ncbi:helix-turn-helix domain-containing protein [Serratia ureilytica]